MPTEINMTPTWSALVPVLLAAYANMTRQLRTDALNMCHEAAGSGWCDVHNTTFREDADPARGCRVRSNPARHGQWTIELSRAIRDTETEFARMAEAADRYNVRAKALPVDLVAEVGEPVMRYPWRLDEAVQRGWDRDAHAAALQTGDVDAISITHPANWLTEDEIENPAQGDEPCDMEV